MCDIADGTNAIDSHVVLVARKTHTCSGCTEAIEVGHSYHRTRVLYDGSWSRWKHCERCHLLMEALQARARDGYDSVAIDPEFGCGTSWLEAWGEPPPPEVEALAFALPGDSR